MDESCYVMYVLWFFIINEFIALKVLGKILMKVILQSTWNISLDIFYVIGKFEIQLQTDSKMCAVL